MLIELDYGLGSKDHMVYVHSLKALYRKGDDLAGFFDLHGRN